MKKFTLSMITVMTMGTFAVAGGDIAPVEEIVEVATPIIVEDDSNFYVGVAYSYVDAEIDAEQTGNAYTLLAGYNYNKYIAIEGRYTATVGDMDIENDKSSLNHSDGEIDREVESYGIFLKPQYPIGDAFSVYALLGYGSVTARTTDESGFQWGLGAKYAITDSIDVFVDYTSLYDGDMNNVVDSDLIWDSQITSTNVGLTYNF